MNRSGVRSLPLINDHHRRVRLGVQVEELGALWNEGRANMRGSLGADGSLDEMYEATRGKGFGAEVQRRILIGTYVLSAGYGGRTYRKAQQVRTRVREDFESADFGTYPWSPTGDTHPRTRSSIAAASRNVTVPGPLSTLQLVTNGLPGKSSSIWWSLIIVWRQ